MYPSAEEKAVAYRTLDGMQKQIIRERPFKITFVCGDREWTAWLPQVITAPMGHPKKFVLVHMLTTERIAS